MSRDQLRLSQVVTTFGPGAMLDLPTASVIVSGVDQWKYDFNDMRLVREPRLERKVRALLENPLIDLRTPPPANDSNRGFKPHITAYRFPEWYVVQMKRQDPRQRWPRRRLVPQSALQDGRYRDPDQGLLDVVPIRFVRACPKGHIDDIDWRRFVHSGRSSCMGDLWLEERGTSSNLEENWVICDGCGARQSMVAAANEGSLGDCRGTRPWLGSSSREDCDKKSRLLIRTASNAYFPQVLSVISIPETQRLVDSLVQALWDDFLVDVESLEDLQRMRERKPTVRNKLADFEDGEVLTAINRVRQGGSGQERTVKDAEMEVLSQSEDEMGIDVPDGDFYARALPRSSWQGELTAGIERVVLVHRLREVAALVGFTRFEAAGPDITGELDVDVERAPLGQDSSWVPAIENRGEGIFIKFSRQAIEEWLNRDAVRKRNQELLDGFNEWQRQRNIENLAWPGASYVMLHSISHMLMTAIVLECGYPSSSIRERIYAHDGSYGVLLYTATSDAEGTLGGLVETGREILRHLRRALEMGAFCSNDPICAQHRPDARDPELLLGSACHGCLLIPETSCEMYNDFLDRALVVPTLENLGAEFFREA